MKEYLLQTEQGTYINLPFSIRYPFQQILELAITSNPSAENSNPDNVLIMSDK